ncbi:hypothetical protein F511_28493 [Dorcoceras hygrometricum]|uniref:Uncharacterized protein n=1 Tax=Dorcoceras hygrometricum TaxID=472368 RepID=A0A2Z7C723_9LAMI|nr:hypothetical protein F511_28493 [Dorcoceras hygrometricum]
MVKRLATSPHDPLGITESACKNQLVMVSVQYGPFKTNIPIRSTTIGKSRVARDPITMHTSRRSNSDIACVTRLLGCRSGSAPRQAAEEQNITGMRSIRVIKQIYVSTYIGCLAGHLSGTCAWLQPVFQEPGASRLIAVDSSIRSTTRLEAPSSDCTRSPDEISTIGFSTKN